MSGSLVAPASKQLQASPSPLVLAVVPQSGETAAGQLFVPDRLQPPGLDWAGGAATGLAVPSDQLWLSIETTRTALIRLPHSALYPLVANWIALMSAAVDTLRQDPATKELGCSCVEMMRALLVSAAAQDQDGCALSEDLLLAQIRDYVHRRLHDPGLTPARIAVDHHISVRQLFNVCSHAGIRLEQWIIAQRLARVRGDLAQPVTRHHPISAIAYSHGFRDPSYFARRFRAAYHMTPTDWRSAALPN